VKKEQVYNVECMTEDQRATTFGLAIRINNARPTWPKDRRCMGALLLIIMKGKKANTRHGVA
jgi:hypothetical protein